MEELSQTINESGGYAWYVFGRVPLDVNRATYAWTIEIEVVSTNGQVCNFTQSFEIPVLLDYAPVILPSPNEVQSNSTSVSIGPSSSPSLEVSELSCSVEAHVSCNARGIGPGLPFPCELVSRPSLEHCELVDGYDDTSIALQYNRKRCDESITRGRNNACFDRDAQTQLPSSVWIRMTDDRLMLIYDQVVNSEEILFVQTSSLYFWTREINVEIYAIEEDQVVQPGLLLQRLTYGTRCLESNALTLLDQIGGLQVVAIRKNNETLDAAYDIAQTFSITNTGNVPLTINSVVTSSTVFPNINVLSHEGIVGTQLPPGQTVIVYEDKHRFFLFDEINVSFESFLALSGTTVVDGVEELCGSNSNVTMLSGLSSWGQS